MFGKSIPEEELASLNDSVQDVVKDPAIYEYRQYELEQVPTPEIVKQAQQIWDLVCELKYALDKVDPKQAKKKVGHLDLVLSNVKERDYSYLRLIIQKAKEISELSKDLIRQDPDFIAAARKDEIYHILAAGSISLDKKELGQVISESDKRIKINSDRRKFNFPSIFTQADTIVSENQLEEVNSNFDRCLDEAYKRFSKTSMGEYLRVYQAIIAKPSPREAGKLRVSLEECRKKLLPEEQRKLERLQLREKTKLELLVSLLPAEEYNRFISQLKRNTKANNKNMIATKSVWDPKNSK